jgi:AhpC/TSA family
MTPTSGTRGSRIGALIAVVAVVGVGYSLVRLLSGSAQIGSQKLVGGALPEFAAPLARSGLNLDANIVSRAAARRSGGHAACDVRVKGAFVSCRDLRGRAIVTFWRREEPVCVRQVDELQKAFAGDHSVHAASVAFKDSVAPVGKLADAHGWTLPVVVDRDAATAELFLVDACPTTYLVRDGRVTGVKIGLLDAAALRRAAGASGNG